MKNDGKINKEKRIVKFKVANVKEEKAITLIALVVTIVILIILASITINTLTNSGIIGQTEKASDKYSQSQKDEDKVFDAMEVYIENQKRPELGKKIGNLGLDYKINGNTIKIYPNIEGNTNIMDYLIWKGKNVLQTTVTNEEKEAFIVGVYRLQIGNETLTKDEILKIINEENSDITYNSLLEVYDSMTENIGQKDEMEYIFITMYYFTMNMTEKERDEAILTYFNTFENQNIESVEKLIELLNEGEEEKKESLKEILGDGYMVSSAIGLLCQATTFTIYNPDGTTVEYIAMRELSQEGDFDEIFGTDIVFTYNMKSEPVNTLKFRVSTKFNYQILTIGANETSYTKPEFPYGYVYMFEELFGVAFYKDGKAETILKTKNGEIIHLGSVAKYKIEENKLIILNGDESEQFGILSDDYSTILVENNLGYIITELKLKECKHVWKQNGSLSGCHKCTKCTMNGYHSNYDWLLDGWMRACDTTCSECGRYEGHIWDGMTCSRCGIENYEHEHSDSGMRYYTDNGDGTHTSWYECSVCGTRYDEIVESHVNSSESGTGSCMDNGDGTHTREIWYNCWDCGASWSKYSTEEHYGDSGMRYYTDNGDGTHTSYYECSGCWARCDEVVESHYDMGGGMYNDNGDGTHTYTSGCSCGGTYCGNVESCYDNDGDGNCDMCWSSIP